MVLASGFLRAWPSADASAAAFRASTAGCTLAWEYDRGGIGVAIIQWLLIPLAAPQWAVWQRVAPSVGQLTPTSSYFTSLLAAISAVHYSPMQRNHVTRKCPLVHSLLAACTAAMTTASMRAAKSSAHGHGHNEALPKVHGKQSQHTHVSLLQPPQGT